MKRLNGSLACAALLCALLSCSLGSERREEGTLIVELPSSLGSGARTIMPDFAAEVDSVSVVVSASGETSQTKSATTPNGTMTFENLATATWTIKVSALKDGAIIGSGEASAAVSSGASVKIVIPITFSGYGSGSGELSLDLSWPSDSGVDYLDWSIDGGTASTAAVATDAAAKLCSATLSASGIAAGAHSLELAFKKGGAEGKQAGRFVESLNVWSGLSSGSWIDGSGKVQGALAFAAGDFLDSDTQLGGLAISLTINGTATAQDLGFSSSDSSYSLGLATATSLAFTPAISLDGQYLVYSWNDAPAVEIAPGASSPNLALANGTNGLNWLKITVRAPDRASTRNYEVTVTKAYRVAFDSNGAGAMASQSVAAGSLATMPTAPTRTGYYFEGWYSDAALSDAWDFASDAVSSDLSLFAKWTQCGAAAVSFTLNPSYKTIVFGSPTATLKRGASVTFSCGDPDLSALTWAWYVDNTVLPGATSSSYTFSTTGATTLGTYAIGCAVTYGGIRYSGSAAVTVSEDYKLSYSGNGNTGGTAPSWSSSDMSLAAQGTLVKSGYSFGGWNTKADGSGTTYAAGAGIVGTIGSLSSSVTLYAVWTNAAPANVTNLSAIGGSGYLMLSWTDPIETDFDYLKIDYTVGGTSHSTRIAKGTQAKLVAGLSNAMFTWYPFLFTSYDREGLASSSFSAQLSVGALTPFATEMTNSCTVSSLAGTAGTVGSGDGTGDGATFNSPRGIATDGANLYVADTANHTIRRIVISTGVVTTLAGTAGTSGSDDGNGSAATFNTPCALTTDGVNLYVSDLGNHMIRKIVISTKEVTTLAGSTTAGGADGIGAGAQFTSPYGIATDGTSLYVSDSGNHTIRRIVIATGAVTTLAGLAGTSGSINDTGTAARFWAPAGIATDGNRLYVSDSNNNVIRKIALSTLEVTTFAGSGSATYADGTGTAAAFSAPYGIVTDGANLYVGDVTNHRIRKIVIATRAVSTLAGTGANGNADGTGSASTFGSPIGMATDGTNLYVAERGYHTIRKIIQ
jgi:uncharacterized repeat protein (TIGR02543 family)